MTEVERSTFGEKIRELRKKRGLTQRQLAKFSGIDHVTINRIENEGRVPSLRTAVKTANSLTRDPLERLILYESSVLDTDLTHDWDKFNPASNRTENGFEQSINPNARFRVNKLK